MTEEDRLKWDHRYAKGAYADRPWPSAILEDWVPQISTARKGHALDIACGAGRNALYLAERGYQVDAIDISSEALRRAGEAARRLGLEINWICADLESGDVENALPPGPCQLITMIRYVNAPLVPVLAERLAPGGYLIIEEHLASDEDVIGPKNPAFRVAPGELTAAVSQLGLEISHDHEGLVTDPDGRMAALARVVARRTHPVGESER